MANVTSIFQSKNGEIWLGMDGSGLVRYDGYTFQEIFQKNVDNDHHVTSITENQDTLFFTSRYKGLFSYYNEQYKRIIKSSKAFGDFLKIVQMDSSKVVITTTGIFLLKDGTITKLNSFTASAESIKINNVIALKNSCIILSSVGNFHISTRLNRSVPLNNWLHISQNAANFISFGYTDGESILFYDKTLSKTLKVVLNEKDEIYDLDLYSNLTPIKPTQQILSLFGDANSKNGALITSENELFRSTPSGFKKVAHNYNKPLESCQEILIDRNGDFWIISSLRGLYKVSEEPFTTIKLDPVYQSPSINTIFKSSKGDIVVSTMEQTTNIGNLYIPESRFSEYPFSTYAAVEYKNQIFLGTSEGLKIFDLQKKQFTSSLKSGNEKVTFLFLDKDILWVGISNQGLSKLNLTEKNPSLEQVKNKVLPSYFYTAQFSADSSKIYFGTNNGIFIYKKSDKTFSALRNSKFVGYYIGVSTIDVYGNIWFTGDKGLLCILKNGQQVLLEDRTILPSTLFYTLNSDSHGNLFIGTNKGITVVKVAKNGKVISSRTYDGKTGFEGYETHMRSQFQEGNNIFVGTIEGLFMINADLLFNLPKLDKPVVEINKNTVLTSKENAIQFIFRVNNPKIKNIEYSYRIKGYEDSWSKLTKENQLFLSDLPNGDFVLEVKATNDGAKFSEIGRYPFTIHLPFWKSKWFVFLLLIGIIVLNVYLINRNRSFSSGNLFNTKDTSITVKLTPQILFFGFVANTTSHLICSYFDPNVQSNLALTLTTGLIALTLYFSALTAKNNQRTYQYKYLLITGFIVILCHNLVGAYISNLHPFFILAIVLINTLSSFVLEKIKSVIIYSLIFILVNVFIVMQLESTIYNKTLYMLAILISAFLSIITIYLRYDSLEKLLFISGVINKGNIPAIAFNSQGIMTYVSENISETINANHETLIGKPISFLNTFVPDDGTFRHVDLTNEFQDGKKYLVPMLSIYGEINWMEWSCKVFTEDVKVIIGQNVTERLELENTYELLVQNADDMIYQCDENGYFQFLNNRCFEKLGYTKVELIGKNALFFVPAEYTLKVSQFYRHHFENKMERSYLEFPVKSKSGETIWIGQNVTTLYKPGEKKSVNGFLALARDITKTREQQEIIKEQRDDITSSINYAQKIQMNLLPTRDKFERSFDEYTIFYKPKDIVSGDFYWLERIDDVTIIALGDCTGHGVPGSFMTLLGINLLNNLILEQRIFHPGTILDELDLKLTTALPRENGDENMNDGMEITICVFNHVTKELSYACAGSRFLIYETNSFTMYKGDTKHIGDKPIPEFNGYITHYTKFLDDSTLYLFTDGFQDQFGGIKNKKYSFRRMLELFESNIRIPLYEHQDIIEEEFDKWRADYVQTDDVTIIALRNLTL